MIQEACFPVSSSTVCLSNKNLSWRSLLLNLLCSRIGYNNPKCKFDARIFPERIRWECCATLKPHNRKSNTRQPPTIGKSIRPETKAVACIHPLRLRQHFMIQFQWKGIINIASFFPQNRKPTFYGFKMRDDEESSSHTVKNKRENTACVQAASNN